MNLTTPELAAGVPLGENPPQPPLNERGDTPRQALIAAIDFPHVDVVADFMAALLYVRATEPMSGLEGATAQAWAANVYANLVLMGLVLKGQLALAFTEEGLGMYPAPSGLAHMQRTLPADFVAGLPATESATSAGEVACT